MSFGPAEASVPDMQMEAAVLLRLESCEHLQSASGRTGHEDI